MKKFTARWIGIGALVILATWYLRLPPKEIFEEKLPRGAKAVKVLLEEDGWFPDYLYLLRARVSREDFGRYVAALSLTPHSPERKYGDASTWLNWGAQSIRGPVPAWWTPSPSIETTFVRQDRQNWTFAKYEDGYVYLKSLNH